MLDLNLILKKSIAQQFDDCLPYSVSCPLANGTKNKRPLYLSLFLALAFLCPSVLFAAENNTLSTKKTQLKSITYQINLIRQRLSLFQTKKTALKDNLEKIELNIGHISSGIRKTNNQLSQQKVLLTSSQKQLNLYNQKLNLQKQLLAQQIKASYILGRQPFLKILLNQEDPNKVMRYLEYYKYITQARLDLITQMKKTTLDIKVTSSKILKQTEKLSSIQLEQQKQHEALQTEHEERQKLLSQTEQAIQDKTERLNKLIADKNALETIIKNLSQTQTFGYFPGANFGQMKGHLHWPLNHIRIIQRFNQPIAFGRLRSSGILLAAKLNENVYAIFPGKVIFADWLHGFGLLVILQHSNGYLSLYARNQSLEVKTGEVVAAGQIIATAGNSGGYPDHGLYFEIRHGSAPVNPLIWLKKA